MKERTLRSDLLLLVDRYGLDSVVAESQELASGGSTGTAGAKSIPAGKRRTATRRPRVRVKASEYVAKMNVDGDKVSAMRALAERFESKSFLPRCADIRNFCHIHGIDERASKSRSAAIPRLFRYLATMDSKNLQRLLDESAFSGPSQLGPLAEAIRERGRAGRRPCAVQEGETAALADRTG